MPYIVQRKNECGEILTLCKHYQYWSIDDPFDSAIVLIQDEYVYAQIVANTFAPGFVVSKE